MVLYRPLRFHTVKNYSLYSIITLQALHKIRNAFALIYLIYKLTIFVICVLFFARLLLIAYHIFFRCTTNDMFKNTVEICNAVKPAIVRYKGYAIQMILVQATTNLTDPKLIEITNKGQSGMFFEIPAKCLWRKVGSFSNTFQCKFFFKMAIDIAADR
ncbi:hypothetical protein D3C73_1129680 [compost metagenome]